MDSHEILCFFVGVGDECARWEERVREEFSTALNKSG